MKNPETVFRQLGDLYEFYREIIYIVALYKYFCNADQLFAIKRKFQPVFV